MASTTTTSTIEVKNIGPVQHVSIPIPEQGGVVVLRGRNGSGKTHTLRAVEAAIAGKGRPSVRDGALRGEVSGLGVTLRVGRTTRRSGELVVDILDGRMNIADLVDPGIKDPAAADAKRIKALISITGQKPDPSLFSSLFASDDEFKSVVSASTLETDDVVLLAERIKRDCEAAARREESLAEHAAGEAKGKREAAEGVDLSVETDPADLQERLERAIQEHSSLVARRDEAEKHAQQRRQAQQHLEQLEASYDGPSVEAARQAVAEAESVVSAKTERVRELERQLAAARAELEGACESQAAAVRQLKAAEHHERVVTEYRQVLESDALLPPDEAAIAAAEQAVTNARQAVEAGALARRAAQELAAAQELEDKARQHGKRAARLREAGKGTDEVLSELITQTGLPYRIEAGRLLVPTSRGETYFGDLSEGERWKLSLDTAIENLGDHGLIPLPQEAWEGLDPINRKAVDDHVKLRRVVLLTAEATDDEQITAEVVA